MPKCLLRSLFPLILVAGAIAGLQGCASQTTNTTSGSNAETTTATNTQNKALKTVKFTLSWLFQGVDAPLAIAIDQGYFAENGVEVQFERGFGSADSINKIASGQFDMGEGDMYSMMEFNQKNPNDKLVAVAIKYNKSPLAIVSLKKNGIAEPQMLQGKNLAAPAGDSARRLWPIFAKSIGVPPDSVTWNNVEPKLREALLAKGSFDAISGFTISSVPPLTNKLGFKPEEVEVFAYTDYGLNLYGNALIVKESFLKENPDLVRGFVQAYLRGLQKTIQDPDTALATALKFNKDGLLEEKLERDRLTIAVESLFNSPEVQQNGLGGVDAARLKKTLEQAAAGFGLTQVPTPEEIFDGSYLPPKEQRTI